MIESITGNKQVSLLDLIVDYKLLCIVKIVPCLIKNKTTYFRYLIQITLITFKHVKGEVYKIDEKMRDFSDMFEEHPHWYTRDKITVQLKLNGSDQVKNVCGCSGEMDKKEYKENDVIECWCYFLKTIPPDLQQCPVLEEYLQEYTLMYLRK